MRHIPALMLLVALTACSETDRTSCDCTTATCISFKGTSLTPITLEGKLSIGEYETNIPDQPYRPYLLNLNKQLCVGGDETAAPDDPAHYAASPTMVIQFAGEINGDDMLNNLGRSVKATGTLLPAVSQWHVTPVVMDIQEITLP